MVVRGLEYIEPLLSHVSFSAKLVFNQSGAIFFPVNREHRNQKSDSISYEDNYRGNALAAMLAPHRIEIRYHQDFSDADVAEIVASLKQHPDLEFMKDWEVTYQGRPIR